MILVEDNVISVQEANTFIELFKKDPMKGSHDETSLIYFPPQHSYILENIKSYVKHDNRFEKVQRHQIVKYPTGVSKGFHFDTGRDNTTGASITFLNDDLVGGEAVVEGVKITPVLGRTYYMENNYKHAVMNVIKGSRYTISVWYEKL
jgi:hypothetical protein|tara:strand:- start:1283 stop:1726 length:444 start_codon:yes stop_codon:yes gene_type:complete